MAGLQDISVGTYTGFKIGNVEIGGVEGFGGFSEETSIIEVKQYGARFARKLAGSSTVAPIELTCSFNPTDAGYVALAAARANDTRSEFTVTYYNNASKTAGAKRTFNGIVTAYAESSENDAARTCTWTIAVDGALGALEDIAGTRTK